MDEDKDNIFFTAQVGIQVGINEQKLIRELLKIWRSNNPTIPKDIRIEVKSILSRGYTDAITFQADCILIGSQAISRVFKIDILENIMKEGESAQFLKNQKICKFICNINNKYIKDIVHFSKKENFFSKQFSILEYDYASNLGLTSTVYKLIDYLKNQIKTGVNIGTYGDEISCILDEVIQGLKTKVYKCPVDKGAQPTKQFYLRQLNKYNHQQVKDIIDNLPLELKTLFDNIENSQNIFDSIDKALENTGHGYEVDIIHGDLNPSNILVYTGNDSRCHGVLIDFLEMYIKSEQKFKSAFWDFARLEGEITLNFFSSQEFLDLSKDGENLNLVMDLLFHLRPIQSDNRNLIAIYDVLFRLRKSFFKTLSDQPVNQTVDFIEAFYIALLVFYLFYLRYYGKPHERLQVPLALYIGHKISCLLPNIKIAAIEFFRNLNGLSHIEIEIDVIEIEDDKEIKRLKKLLFEIKEEVVELSNLLFEITQIANTAKAIFLREFGELLYEKHKLEQQIEALKHQIKFKKENPHSTLSEVEEEANNFIKEKLENEQKQFEDDLKKSNYVGDRSNINYLNKTEHEEAKKLWRKLIRKAHPDLNPLAKSDSVLNKILEELYEMKEIGGTGYNIGKLNELEARLERYETEMGKIFEHGFETETQGKTAKERIEYLKKRIDTLHKRKKELDNEIEKVEKSEEYLYRDFIQKPELKEKYKKEYEDKLERKKVVIKELISQLAKLFKMESNEMESNNA